MLKYHLISGIGGSSNGRTSPFGGDCEGSNPSPPATLKFAIITISMKITFRKFKDFQNKWVAIDEKTEQVVASGKTISDVQKKAAKKNKRRDIVLEYIRPFNSYLSPSNQ